jgi:outer membrane protein assembly factor BamA
MKVSGMATLLLGAGVASVALAAEEPQLQVQNVECRGNHSTSCEFIRSHLNLSAGMPLSEVELRNAQLRLSSLRNFEAVDVRLEKGAQRDAVIVVIEVTEASPITTESLAGLSSRLEATRSVFAGRIAHQNLFGAGKTIDLAAVAITPLGGSAYNEEYSVHLRYADPNLFGSDRYFAVARASWLKVSRRDVHGNFSDFKGAELDVRIGRRFGDFSYVTLSQTFHPNVDWVVGEWDFGGETDFDRVRRSKQRGGGLIYGWNSEDDLYFPTRGFSFHIGAGWDFGSGSPADRSHVQFRKTWDLHDSFLTVKLGGSPSPEYRTSFEESQLLSVSYARPFKATDDLKRGRWYVEPGIGAAGYTSQNERIYEVGIKAGVRLDTISFGIVDLYLMATQDPQR